MTPASPRYALKVERDENDQRKEPTVSEKVALSLTATIEPPMIGI